MRGAQRVVGLGGYRRGFAGVGGLGRATFVHPNSVRGPPLHYTTSNVVGKAPGVVSDGPGSQPDLLGGADLVKSKVLNET